MLYSNIMLRRLINKMCLYHIHITHEVCELAGIAGKDRKPPVLPVAFLRNAQGFYNWSHLLPISWLSLSRAAKCHFSRELIHTASLL